MTTVHSSLIFPGGDTTILRRLLDDATPLDRAKALKRGKLGRMRGLVGRSIPRLQEPELAEMELCENSHATNGLRRRVHRLQCGLEMISGSADLMARHREQAQSRLDPSQSEAAR